MYRVGAHATLEYRECCLCQFVKHVETHGFQPHIDVPSLICDILSVRNKYIISCDNEIGAAPSVLNLSYKLNVGNNVEDIISNICALILDGDMLEIFYLNLLLLIHKYIIIHIVLNIMFDICASQEQNSFYCNFVVFVLVLLLFSKCAHSRLDFSVTSCPF